MLRCWSFFFSSRRRHTRFDCDWSSDVCSSDLIDAYPLAEFDGKMKKHDWSKLPHFPQPDSGGAETKWVSPEAFFDQLPLLLDDATPLAGEEPRYAALRELVAAAQKDPKLKAAMIDEAKRAHADLVA